MKKLRILMKPSPERRLYEEVMQQCKQPHILRGEDLGEGMAAVYDSQHRPRYILDNKEKTAFTFVSDDYHLATVRQSDLNRLSFLRWEEYALDRANNLIASLPIRIEPFRNGVARVAWMIQSKGHDGYYYMDEDGFGMEDEKEIVIYGYINKKGKVVGQFREPYFGDWEYDYRLQAENNERTGVVEGAYVVSEEKRKRIDAMSDAKKAMIETVSKTLEMDDTPSLDDLGEGMVQIKGKNHSFAIGNLMTGKLRQLVNVEGVLIVDDSEIDIDAIKRNCRHYDGSYSVKWIGCEDFKNGVCAIIWVIYLETGVLSEQAFCIINHDLKIVEPFRPIVKTDDVEKALKKY